MKGLREWYVKSVNQIENQREEGTGGVLYEVTDEAASRDVLVVNRLTYGDGGCITKNAAGILVFIRKVCLSRS